MSEPLLEGHSVALNADHRIYDAGFAHHEAGSPIDYGVDYFDHYSKLEATRICTQLNRFRVDFSDPGSSKAGILDIGVGSLTFLKSCVHPRWGVDVNPLAVAELIKRGWHWSLSKGLPRGVKVVTMWDVLEHIPEPTAMLKRFPPGLHVCLSLPLFDDLRTIESSKHYKPHEHLWYWSKPGLMRYFRSLGYFMAEYTEEESALGREGIGSFRFIKESS